MNAQPIRFRHIHLDFHTSPACTDVGADFDADLFARTLQEAKVNAINIFAKCHHGYSYYPTKVGTVHPGLKSGDLLGEQIEALHRAGIVCPIYLTVMWDELAGEQHPEWVIVNKDGRVASRAPLSNAWGWTTLDVSSDYAGYLMDQVTELAGLYEVDGFWFDICFPRPNYSPWGQAQMRAAGVPLDDDEAVWAFARHKQERFFDKMTRHVKALVPEATIFYNGTISRDMRRIAPYATHFEVESLPTSGTWGYLHYPVMARQARTYGKPMIGMTGRFHTSWGDFGGIKTTGQLLYECATVIAAGGRVCVGDQLHPRGVLDPAVYRLVGDVYARIEALEPWLVGAAPAAEAAVLATGPLEEELNGIGTQSPDTEGAIQMFIELGIQCDLVDCEADLSGYRLVVLPDGTKVDSGLKTKLDAFVAAGGALIFSGTAALAADGHAFVLEHAPVRYIEPAPTTPSYLRPVDIAASGSDLAADYDYAFYGQAHVVEPLPGATAYGDLRRAYFSRTWETFMGHQHAPVDRSLGAPVAVRNGAVLYLAAPLFAGYKKWDYFAYRAMVAGLLDGLLSQRLLYPQGPGWVEYTLHTQEPAVDHGRRKIVHVIAYQPRRSLQPIAHVDQAWTVAGLGVKVRCEKKPKRVYLAPDEGELAYSFEEGYVSVELPPLNVYAVVVIEE
ncbi:MAG: beta-galactosidase trimerization domain-containing protein [Caldilineaceae bacterium]|nr:beta-galactosidase trimerization domain-containing protein [Caldilineaceae bacterium]